MNPAGRAGRWRWLLAVFIAVVAFQLWLVAAAGTDIPFQDQWDAEGRWLYPAFREGSLRFVELFRPHSEHRIFWTRALDLALFSANGQWDPLVQLVAGAFLRGGVAVVLLAGLLDATARRGWPLVALGVTLAFLPQLAWHNALWGFQSQVYFVVGFSLLALRWLAVPGLSWRVGAGVAAAGAALVSMGAGAAVGPALLGLVWLRAVEQRRIDRDAVVTLAIGAMLLVAGIACRATEPAHASLRASGSGQFLRAFAMICAWPHVAQPAAALVMQAPVIGAVLTRLLRRRTAVPGEDFVLAVAAWALVAALGVAWTRGGGAEFQAGVPSRYVDFFVLLPVANGWCALLLARSVLPARRRLAVAAAAVWLAFVAIGWVGLSTEMMRRIVLPRARDRDAPVRLAVAFQRSDSPAVFEGQPRLLVPHPDVNSVRAVLRDPRMEGALPPSFQPERPKGPLSRAVRWLLRR